MTKITISTLHPHKENNIQYNLIFKYIDIHYLVPFWKKYVWMGCFGES